VLSLGFHAEQFRAIDVPSTLVGTGVELRGPVFGATSPGACWPTAGSSISPTWSTSALDLEDPSIADLVD
jgi:hypothetical protein